MGFEIKGPDNPGANLTGIMQQAGGVISGMKFSSRRQTADDAAAFKDQDLTARFAQQGGRGQAVMAGTDDNYIIFLGCLYCHTLKPFAMNE